MNKFLIQRRKIVYYGKSFLALFIPKFLFRIRIDSELKKINNYDLKYLESRVNYYNKIEKKFQLDSESLNINELFKIQIKKIKSKAFQNKKIKKRTTYFFDLYKYLSYFPPFFKVRFKFSLYSTEEEVKLSLTFFFSLDFLGQEISKKLPRDGGNLVTQYQTEPPGPVSCHC